MGEGFAQILLRKTFSIPISDFSTLKVAGKKVD